MGWGGIYENIMDLIRPQPCRRIDDSHKNLVNFHEPHTQTLDTTNVLIYWGILPSLHFTEIRFWRGSKVGSVGGGCRCLYCCC